MARKCPPGVICIENMTIIFLIIVVVLFGIVYFNFINTKSSQKNVFVTNTERNSLEPKMSSLFSTNMSNTLMNPFLPPLKKSHYLSSSDPRGIPININTRGVDMDYKQMGILTRTVQKQNDDTILPVMGRPLYTNKSKWQYYTMNDKNNAIKLPMSHNGRSCTNEYGCDELLSGDTVYVEGYNDSFKVTIYENSQPRYIPFV